MLTAAAAKSHRDVYRGLAAARVALVAAPQLHRRRVTVRWLLS